VDKTSGVEVTYLYWEATYVMLFCVTAIINNLLVFFFSDTVYLAAPAQIPFSSRQTLLVQQAL
jgi:hypothetical protein